MRAKQVIVDEYSAAWPRLFKEEAERISASLNELQKTIEHIGSTAVPGLRAKPVIDIMIGVSSLEQADSCVPLIERTGYLYRPEHEDSMPERRYFERSGSEIDYHVHMVVFESKFWRDHIFFRDYLRENPEAAEQYADLKEELAGKFRDNREAYTNGKAEFIQGILRRQED
ncbi:hypothetical protein V511_05730 [Mesotoga sp. Brook.08.YT.4.2.5.1]|uniref:GrpB family protein n=1 Tax=unclassified Mesotoga TaxID=1184398 RepID=UPI000C9BFB4E|nr:MULTISPECIES: GrpB family protein [unclassified Mesotoga]PNQ04566.1 hypothetical protein RM69_07960 [Mesotoga sp. SC_NapDC3]PXF33706.1 hypothetical protein EU77_12070 [Mesotoga sp. SC_NapDC]PNE22864.1 hypothetical protein V511_05730 [Mesotoga sp. Brook.08.YT.4.2.5.1]RAO96110.1 hypothetical protein M388_03360 [Mesotoga sp. Brook.08.YT.4.2.5.4.]RDI90729.1 hypothetical protein Q502_13005 [Mesotoga sp. Brook.08.YT.4.2.5.2.]